MNREQRNRKIQSERLDKEIRLKTLERKVRRVLDQNRKAGRRPVSLYDYGKMEGIARQQFYMVLHGNKASQRVLALLERLVNSKNGKSGGNP